MLVEVMKINKSEVTACTSLDVAETFGKEHARVMRDIRELECSEEFRVGNFAETKYTDSHNRKQPMYIMSRDGFTLLVMGYTGKEAMVFKETYIKQFNAMERILKEKYVEREKGIAVRQALTKSLQLSQENERMHGHAYSAYTNCIYKTILGKDAKHLREQYGIGKKDNLRDCFAVEELKAVESMECLVSGLVDCGWDYDKIKSFIENANTKRIAM